MIQFNRIIIIILATLHSFWDLSSLTMIGTVPTILKVLSPNHWTAREFPVSVFFSFKITLLKALFYSDYGQGVNK